MFVMESRKWVILIATIWIQSFTGTNFDFSSYSSELKSVLQITQLQLNYLSVASDMGKALGWCSGVSLLYLPLWLVMFMASFLGLVGYGIQWLVIKEFISLPYFGVFFLCLIAGCSICWFNTICYVLCIKNFTSNKSLALSLSISFNGVSAALYTLIANAINSDDDTLYLLLNAIVPLLISAIVLIPILQKQNLQNSSINDTNQRDFSVFLCLYILALVTGLYLLCLYSLSSTRIVACVVLLGAIFLLVFHLFLPRIVQYYTEYWSCLSNINAWFNVIDPYDDDDDDNELQKGLIGGNEDSGERNNNNNNDDDDDKKCGFEIVLEKDQIEVLGEEHSTRVLIRKWDFWLYYMAYLCGGTIGLVYSNNLGQIAQSLGHNSQLSSIVTLYSTCSFFGRLLSAAPDFLGRKIHFARTGWFAIALIPTPIALILLAISGSTESLIISTSLIGLSSGFVFSAAVSITSELFGPNNVGVNHNILITNIPLGSCLYGLLAALIYDSNAQSTNNNSNHNTTRTISIWLREMTMCMGRKCYLETFIWWGCFSLVGLVSSFVLYFRTRLAYDNFGRNRT